MKITDSQRATMTHNALDSSEVQELKRLWWSLYNSGRVYDWLEVTPLMSDLETMVTAMVGHHLTR